MRFRTPPLGRLRQLAAVWLTVGVIGCGAPSLMSYHREALDPLAMAQLNCEQGPLEVTDTTPDTMRGHLHDPDARRYTVSGCGRQRTYLCYQFPMNTIARVECEWLADTEDGGSRIPVHLGTVRVR